MSERTGLPEPLTPPDCDLRGLEFMPLDVVRLVDSDLFAWSSGEEFKAAVALWCKAWLQVPAGSLPDDDRSLTNLSGLGRDIKAWMKVREMALHGFIKCSDGRLYHPVISEKAIDAMQRREEHRDKQENNAERQRRWREEQKQLSDELRKLGVKPPRGASKETLRDLLDSVTAATQGDVTHNDAVTVTTALAVTQGNAAVMPKTGTGTGTGTNIVLRAGDPPPPEQPSEPAPSASATKLGSRLPTDWVLPKPWGDWAQAEKPHWSKEFIRSLGEKFRDHWIAKTGKDARKADWEATWRNWVRSEKDPFTAKKPSSQATPDLKWVPPELRGTIHDPNFSGVIIDAEQ